MMFVITGCGLVSPLASSLDDLAGAIASGRTAAGKRAEGFEERAQVPSRRARRLSRLALMSVGAARSAMADAGVQVGDRTAVVLATGFGSLGTTVQFMRGYQNAAPEPALFPTSVLNEPAAQMAIELGARGPNLTVLQHEASFHAAVLAAADLLTERHADVVLLGGCDEWSDELREAYAKLGLLSKSGHMRPLDRRRDGFVGGEAAACFVLERAGEREARVRAAIRAAEPGDAVDYVALDANGGVASDRAAISRLPQRNLPAGSILAQTGEFAASAALRLAQALLAVERGLRAGTVGFDEADPDAIAPGLLRAPKTAPTRHVLLPCAGAAPLLIHRY
jgi:3-oxoacyl-(acyl-carrier-protein) synthase